MVKTKGIDASMKNWTGAQPRVAAAYAAGVARADDPIGRAIAAEPLYQAKLQQSFAENARVRGLSKVTNEQWKAAATDKGAKRIVDGMRAAEPKMRTGLTRVLNKLETISLPPRTADGIENLHNRAGAVVKGLMELKKE